MTSDVSDWDEDLPADWEEDYQAFVRTLGWTEGFRLLFVQCTPTEGEELIGRVRDDLPRKRIEVLRLDGAIDNLYKIVASLLNREQINILFIQGLEHSFYEYEKRKFGKAVSVSFKGGQGFREF
jgi:DNA-dependent RNA polymerase auxiliary subunit epsilon